MKNLNFLMLGLTIAFSMAMVSCSTEEVKLNGVKLSSNELFMFLDSQPQKLYVYFYPYNATNQDIRWEISSENIISITQGGIVSPVGLGETYAIVYQGDRPLDTCFVTVSPVKRIAVNLIQNPGFELPTQLVAPFTTQINEIEGGWENITIEWANEFYKQGEEKSGPIGIGRGTRAVVDNTQRAINIEGANGNFGTNGNSEYFLALGGLKGNSAARLGNAGGGILAGIYQIVEVEEGERYRYGAIVGMRGNNANQTVKDYETLKILSPDGMEVYHEVIMNPNESEEGDIFETFNGQPAFIRRVKGTFIVAEGVTHVRFQLDTRPMSGTTNSPVFFVDDCYLELDVD